MKRIEKGSFPCKYNYKDKDTNIDNYVRYMLVRTLTMFQYHDLPDTIPQREMEQALQINGHVGIIQHEGNLYALTGSFAGKQDAYGNPTQYLITNPWLPLNKEFTIGEDVVIIYNDDLAIGLMPLLQKYCTLLNENDITMLLSDVNYRIQTLISASDDRTIESAKQYFKKIFDGDLGVISENKVFDSMKINNAASVPHMKELFEYHQYLRAGLFNEIGLNANFNMKRERLTAGEVEMNSESLYPFIDNMMMCRESALDEVNELFGTDISVEFNSSWDYRLNNGEPLETAALKNTNEDTEQLEVIEEDDPIDPEDDPEDPVDPEDPKDDPEDPESEPVDPEDPVDDEKDDNDAEKDSER